MITDRTGLTVLTVDECMQLLTTHLPRIGRVSFIVDRRPVILPVNYVFSQGSVVFRTDPGAKLSAAADSQHIAFEVDEIDTTWREGWSVLVQGRAELVTDPVELDRLRQLPLRPWGPGDKASYVQILPAEISGRRIN